MAGRREVILEFVGDDSRLVRTLRNVEDKSSRTLGAIGKLGKVGGAASAFLGAANSAMTLGSALTTVAPAALALPGILAGVAVATQTAKLALSGFSDAVGGDAKAMAKLAPNAQAAARAVRGLGDGFSQMRSAVQQAFFAGLASEIRLTGTELLKLGTQQLPKVATGLNGIARESLAAARTPFFTNDLTEITDNTGRALDRMRMTGANLLVGLSGLSAVGSQYLPAIGTAADSAAAKFRAWVDAGVESGRINDLIDGAVQGFRDLGALLGAVGQLAATVWTGLNSGLGAAASPLTLITEKINIMQQALAQPGPQEALRLLGEAIAAISAAFTAVLPVLIQFAATIATALLPYVTQFAQLIAEWPTVFAAVVAGVVGLVAAAKLLLGIAAVVRGAIAAWTVAQTALSFAMSATLGPIGIVITLIGLLVAALIYAWQNCETFRSTVLGAWEAVKTGISAAIAGIKVAVAWFGSLPGMIGGWMSGVANSISQGWNQAVAFTRSIPGKIVATLAGLPGMLMNSGRAMINGFLTGLRNKWNEVMAWVRSAMATLRSYWPFSPAKKGAFSGRGYVTFSGQAIGSDFAASLAKTTPLITSAADRMMGAASGALSGGSIASAGLPAPSTAPAGGAVRVELVAGGGADAAVATLIMQLIRTGKLQLRAV